MRHHFRKLLLKGKLGAALRVCLASALLAVCALTVAPGASAQITFVHMSDPQFGLWSKPLLFSRFNLPWNDDVFYKETALFEEAVAKTNQLHPDFVVITGDLINRPGQQKQTAEFKRIAAQLDDDIPLYLLPGNHDVGNHPDAESLAWYRKTFGPDHYSFTRPGSANDRPGLYGIAINSELLNAPDNAPAEAAAQTEWLIAELEKAAQADPEHIVIFMHRPLFYESADEGNRYFNIRRKQRDLYLALFHKYEVSAVLSGHYHRNVHSNHQGMELLTTASVGRPLGDDPSGFSVLTLYDDHIERRFVPLR